MSENEITVAPSWLVAAVDQRLALMADVITNPAAAQRYDFIMTTLTEPEPGADYEVWDKSCDNCGTVPEVLFAGVTSRELHGVRVQFSFGCCVLCKDLP